MHRYKMFSKPRTTRSWNPFKIKRLQTLEDQKTLRETLLEHLGPLSQKYVGAILTGERAIWIAYTVFISTRME